MCPVGYPLMRDKRTCQPSEFCVCVCVCGGGGGVYMYIYMGNFLTKHHPMDTCQFLLMHCFSNLVPLSYQLCCIAYM